MGNVFIIDVKQAKTILNNICFSFPSLTRYPIYPYIPSQISRENKIKFFQDYQSLNYLSDLRITAAVDIHKIDTPVR